VIVRQTGGVCDTTPSVGDILNTSLTSEYAAKRSGPVKWMGEKGKQK